MNVVHNISENIRCFYNHDHKNNALDEGFSVDYDRLMNSFLIYFWHGYVHRAL